MKLRGSYYCHTKNRHSVLRLPQKTGALLVACGNRDPLNRLVIAIARRQFGLA